MHHENPTLSVLEVATDTGNLLLQKADLKKLAKTWDFNTAVRDEALISKDAIQQGSAKVLDFAQELPSDVSKDQYDILCVSDAALLSYVQLSVGAVGRMCEAVKHGGTLCLLVTDSMLSSIQPALDINNMQKPLIHIPAKATGSGLAIFKKSGLSSTNGISSPLTNGTNGTNGINGALPSSEITLIIDANPTEMTLAVTLKLIAILKEHDYDSRVFCWGSDVSALAGRSCISLLEIEKPLLRDLTEADFEPLKKLILETKSLFWVTKLDDPSTAMIDGLVRVVRNETPGLDVRIFHADEPSALSMPANILTGLMSKAFLYTGADNEFHVKDDVLQICRAEEDTVLNEEIDGLLPGATKTITRVRLGDIEYPVKLGVQSPGILSSVCLEPDESAEAELEPDFVEIQTKATALK